MALALVQHGNQYLITDGYDNREGLATILEGFDAVLALHLTYRVPLNLHLSGTLIEAIAWHQPDFFECVKLLLNEGLLEMIGSTYSQNIMTLFSPEHNRRQLNEALWLYERHLAVRPKQVKPFWVPERVWDTARLAPLVSDVTLLNGGYECVLLDDRLGYPLNGDYASSARGAFDTSAAGETLGSGGEAYRIAPGPRLIALPISRALRYCIPPRSDEQWKALERMLTGAHSPDTIHIYGDDLEKSAAVGPWGSRPWRRDALAPYEEFLKWIRANPRVEPMLLSAQLSARPPRASRHVDAGTYYELAQQTNAGEDYQGWWAGKPWQKYRNLLTEAERELLQLRGGSALVELGWKQLMACSYETAWHESQPDGTFAPAPWAKAAAAHVRAVFVIIAAAQWTTQRDGHVHIEETDIDRDGNSEVIVYNDSIYAVWSPQFGARLIYLFDLEQGSVVVGNPADDWNWQEEQNRFMQTPRNHPGAFADVGHENDRYIVQSLQVTDGAAILEFVNREDGSDLVRTVKTFIVESDTARIQATYQVPAIRTGIGIEFGLSPDYLNLLRHGKNGATPVRTRTVSGWRSGNSVVYVRVPDGEPLDWDPPSQPECGHGLMLRLNASARHFRIELGVGEPDRGARECDSIS